ncbi:MAG: ethanolamine utilization protein EutA [Chloroflexota bacterium]|jgi:ethanolamine utilization protein EutA|nr:ethanolamine utilization protein EutA [Chloroflexota bacterium]
MIEDTQEKHTHRGTFAGLHSHAGGTLHWHDEFGEHSAEQLGGEEIALQALDWKMHNVELTTIGVDIGSSTSHLMFSRVYIQQMGEGVAARFVVVGREILWKSPIILTPYLDDDTIDAEVLRGFIGDAFREVRASTREIDTGSIILTGEALKRKNARAIAELFAVHAGKFVTASAGHHLEAVLAANGSGTVARSRRDHQTLLNVDIGGGTTKLALVRDGEILATSAVAVGARLLVKNAEGRLTRIDGPARQVAAQLGITLTLGAPLTPDDEARIVQAWTDVLAGLIERQPPTGLAAELMLSDPLPADPAPEAFTFSGGVSEFIYFRETRDFGDMGLALGKALRKALASGVIKLPAIIDPNLGIRATAIGASLFTTQVSSNTFVSNEDILPLRNVPVLVPTLDLAGEIDPQHVATAIHDAIVRADLDEGEQPIALAFRWPGELVDSRVRTLAEGIRAGIPQTVERGVPFVLLTNQTIGKALGSALKHELAVPGDLVSLDGVSVAEFDFIDLAPVIHPTEVVPIAIKSLLFAGGMDQRSVKQALLDAARSLAASAQPAPGG